MPLQLEPDRLPRRIDGRAFYVNVDFHRRVEPSDDTMPPRRVTVVYDGRADFECAGLTAAWEGSGAKVTSL